MPDTPRLAVRNGGDGDADRNWPTPRQNGEFDFFANGCSFGSPSNSTRTVTMTPFTSRTPAFLSMMRTFHAAL